MKVVPDGKTRSPGPVTTPSNDKCNALTVVVFVMVTLPPMMLAVSAAPGMPTGVHREESFQSPTVPFQT